MKNFVGGGGCGCGCMGLFLAFTAAAIIGAASMQFFDEATSLVNTLGAVGFVSGLMLAALGSVMFFVSLFLD